jgi:hypothetical protein
MLIGIDFFTYVNAVSRREMRILAFPLSSTGPGAGIRESWADLLLGQVSCMPGPSRNRGGEACMNQHALRHSVYGLP